MEWKVVRVVLMLGALAVAFIAGVFGGRTEGRLEACEHVCGGAAEWATIGDGCVCVVREQVRRGG